MESQVERGGGRQNEQNWAAIYLFQLDFIMVILLSMRSILLADFFFLVDSTVLSFAGKVWHRQFLECIHLAQL